MSLVCLVQVQNHITFNFSLSLLGCLTKIFDENESHLSSSSSKILNHLGQEAEIRYSFMKDGDEVNLISYPEDDLGNSSE